MLFSAGLIVALVASATPAQSAAVREQCERELALVRHLRRHVADPSDGLAFAADRRDLARRGPGTPADGTQKAAPESEPVERLSVVADLWYARIIERTPFHLMSRERIARLEQAQ